MEETSATWLPVIKAAHAAGCPKDQIENFVRGKIVLQPLQLQASAAARLCDRESGPTEIGFGGARGGGKSHWALAQVGGDDCQRFPGLKCLWLRKVGKANTEQLQDLRRRVLAGVDHVFVDHKGILKFPNTSIIIAGHFQNESDIDHYLGLEYDIIVIEEATTLSFRKFKDIRTCLRSSKGWRPRMYLTTNPGGIGHQWFKQRFILPFRRREETETRFVPALATDNGFINPDYHRALDSLRGWQRAAWKDGSWDLPMGQYFPNFREDIHVLRGPFDDTLIREWSAAMDYGFTHYTCAYLGGADSEGNFHVIDCHRERQKLPQWHAREIKSMIARHRIGTAEHSRKLALSDLTRFCVGADAFSKQPDGTTIAQQYAKHGIKLTLAFTDRIQGWSIIQDKLGDPSANQPAKLFIHERCAALIESIPTLQHDPSRPEDVLKIDCDDDGFGGDDDADTLRYLVASKPRRVLQRKLAGL